MVKYANQWQGYPVTDREIHTRVPSLLQDGEVLAKHLLATYNHTFLVELGGDDNERCLAIYKPRDAEIPLWDFPPGTLYRRERLAYLVSEALGWHLVPLTVIREGPDGVGSMQQFVPHQRERHYFNMMPEYREQMARVAILDCLINSCDRKGGHTLLDAQGQVWAIDNGLSFTPGMKLRTVMWDLADEPMPAELKNSVSALCLDHELGIHMSEHLSGQEIEAFMRRIDVILASDTIPISHLSDPYRPVPWPQI